MLINCINRAATGGGQSTQAQRTTHDVLLLGGEARRVFGGSQLILQQSVYGFRWIVMNHHDCSTQLVKREILRKLNENRGCWRVASNPNMRSCWLVIQPLVVVTVVAEQLLQANPSGSVWKMDSIFICSSGKSVRRCSQGKVRAKILRQVSGHTCLPLPWHLSAKNSPTYFCPVLSHSNQK